MNNTLFTASIISFSIFISACVGKDIKPNINSNDQFLTTTSNDTSSNRSSSEITDESNIKSNQQSDNKPHSIAQAEKIAINFKFDKVDIAASDKEIIKKQADFLISNPKYVLTVNGHSDNRGPLLYNEKLSLNRANSVASLLISYGTPESQIIINSFGATQPIDDENNWAQNRRVELKYSELYMVSK